MDGRTATRRPHCRRLPRPCCVLSNDALAMLDEAGLAAQQLPAGYPEWKASGLQVNLPRH